MNKTVRRKQIVNSKKKEREKEGRKFKIEICS